MSPHDPRRAAMNNPATNNPATNNPATTPATARHNNPASPASPASVWLCAPAPWAPDPVSGPIWARRVIETFSGVGERVVLRGLAGNPGLAGEMAVLLRAATETGRRPLALLPTPTTAARTRALLALMAHHDNPDHPDHPDDGPGDGPDDADADDAAGGAERPDRASDTDRPPLMLGQPRRPSPASLVTVPAGHAGQHAGGTARARVEVGRRRAGSSPGGAGLVVVLAGPVAPGARASRRGISARLLASWARVLRPGGLLVVLSPPPLGRGLYRARRTGHALIEAAQDAGLAYTQHIVLVHVPVTDSGQLLPPEGTRRPHAPFLPVHTDLLVLTHYPSEPDPLPTGAGVPPPPPLPAPPAAPPGSLATRPDTRTATFSAAASDAATIREAA